jgi:hypothetical protein
VQDGCCLDSDTVGVLLMILGPTVTASDVACWPVAGGCPGGGRATLCTDEVANCAMAAMRSQSSCTVVVTLQVAVLALVSGPCMLNLTLSGYHHCRLVSK